MVKPAIENDGKHILAVVARTKCDKHDAPSGTPCWRVYSGSTAQIGFLAAVCGLRVKRAGFLGVITPTSLSTSAAGGRTGGRVH